MKNNSFVRARFILTGWYCGLLFFILFIFSLFLYTAQSNDFTRIIIQRDFGGRVPKVLTTLETKEIKAQLKAIRQSFIINLLVIDGIVLVTGGGLSYFLAGLTLSPIQKNLQKQKEFLADASHELRTPLAAIQTATEVAMRSTNRTKEEYREVIQQILGESTRLTKMANDLLALSRMETGISPHTFVKLSLHDIASTVLKEIKPLAQKKNITLQTMIEDAYIMGDKYKITQLVMILVDNAITYTTKGGKIEVIVQKNPKTQLMVKDNGRGISAPDQKRIFDRFYQVDPSRSEKGAGIGLSIAKLIVQLHKATLVVESQEGHGSAFSVIFPSPLLEK
ncbi:MAG TPA: HAMP domain-containing sensor histidine kinase [Candidatus Saccharimonadales bacterium]|nr:HAMP domain-containing sensor histidine kinase [Candidatus Saccharimonadales bacterium]